MDQPGDRCRDIDRSGERCRDLERPEVWFRVVRSGDRCSERRSLDLGRTDRSGESLPGDWSDSEEPGPEDELESPPDLSSGVPTVLLSVDTLVRDPPGVSD